MAGGGTRHGNDPVGNRGVEHRDVDRKQEAAMKRRTFIGVIGSLLAWRPARANSASARYCEDCRQATSNKIPNFGESSRQKLTEVEKLLEKLGLNYTYAFGVFGDTINVRSSSVGRINEDEMDGTAEQIASSVRESLIFNHELLAEKIRCGGDERAAWKSLQAKHKKLKA